MSFPELTPYGRYFKLTGYTIGQRQSLPFAVMGQVGVTSTQNAHDSAGGLQVPRDGGVVFTGGSVFVAGKANDYLGGFVQWTFDNFQGRSAIRACGRRRLRRVDRLAERASAICPVSAFIWSSVRSRALGARGSKLPGSA